MKQSDFIDLENSLNALKEHLRDPHKYLSFIRDCKSIFDRCPFNVGDTVQLTKTPEITLEKSWVWFGSKHFLVEGAVCKVIDIDFYNGTFYFYVKFENQTWFDCNNVEHKPKDLNLFSFSEHYLSKTESNTLETIESI